MKLYQSKHSLQLAELVGAGNIPLAKLEVSSDVQNIAISYNPVLVNVPKKIPVQPLDLFSRANPYLFTESGSLAVVPAMTANNGSYVLRPPDAVEFWPQNFDISCLVKKDLQWQTGRIYDIEVGAIASDAFTQAIMPLFGDAAQRGICPANMRVNSGDMHIESMTDKSIDSCDVLFIESANGVSLTIDGVAETIDLAAILDKNVNVWLAVDSFETLFETTDICTQVQLQNSKIYGSKIYDVTGLTGSFNVLGEHPVYTLDTYSYQQLCSDNSAAIVLIKDQGGMVLVTEKKLLTNAADNAPLLYELLFDLFRRSWACSAVVNTWITDYPVDYVIGQSARTDNYHGYLNLNLMLAQVGHELYGEYVYDKIFTSQDNIVLTSVLPNGDLCLRKTGTASDPVKTEHMVSRRVQSGSVIQYQKNVMYNQESGIKIEPVLTEVGWNITMSPIFSSSQNICIKNPSTVRLLYPDCYICCKNDQLSMVAVSSYNIANDGIWIARIKVVFNETPTLRDLRYAGGGLPIDTPDDYDRIDIGLLEGRPLRYGSAVVIRLPKRAQEHKDTILSSVAEHLAAGEYPILVFE